MAHPVPSPDPASPPPAAVPAAAPAPTEPAAPAPAAPAVSPAPETRLAAHRIKRCNYRRLVSLDWSRERVYEVECLYPDRRLPVPLGDFDSAMPICNSCAAPHIFRADED